jgi:hypothetical protein
MSLFYFDLFNDIDSSDDEGQDLADLAAAISAATRYARAMAAESVNEGHLDLRHRIEVRDAAGAIVATVKFGDAVAIVG